MGRANHVDGLFVKLAQRDIRSPAFQALSALAVRTIIELEMHYWETDRLNPITLTQRWLAERLSINPKTAARVVEELNAHWFLELERFGKITGPNNERAARYRLTWLPTSNGAGPTRDSRKWAPEPRLAGARKKGAPTGTSAGPNAARSALRRTTFRGAGETASDMLKRLQSQRQREIEAESEGTVTA